MSNYKKTNKSPSKRSAFTLIELSIVLIIIGLLLAGITGGASLIKSAELRAVMAEARDYKIAANAFFVKYDSLPGDYDAVLTRGMVITKKGNANGTIDNYYDGVYEGDQALQGLYAADIGGMDYYNDNNVGPLLPSAKIKTAGWIFGSRAIAKNVLFLAGIESEIYGEVDINDEYRHIEPGMSYNQAISIDNKMDDGVVSTGLIRSKTPASYGGSEVGAISGVDCESVIDADDTISCNITFDL